MIVDGPRDDLAAADTAWVTSGSANWSSGAATRYDENTLVIFDEAHELAEHVVGDGAMLRRDREHGGTGDHVVDEVLDRPLGAEGRVRELRARRVPDHVGRRVDDPLQHLESDPDRTQVASTR